MKRFCCFAMGKNFPGELRGKSEPFGFFVSAFVNAIDSKDAEIKALELLSANLGLVTEDAGLPPNATVSFKVVHELAHQIQAPKLTEFQFFEMDE